jgi:hypothetical protein
MLEAGWPELGEVVRFKVKLVSEIFGPSNFSRAERPQVVVNMTLSLLTLAFVAIEIS